MLEVLNILQSGVELGDMARNESTSDVGKQYPGCRI